MRSSRHTTPPAEAPGLHYLWRPSPASNPPLGEAGGLPLLGDGPAAPVYGLGEASAYPLI